MAKKTAESPPKPVDQTPAATSSPSVSETTQPSGETNPTTGETIAGSSETTDGPPGPGIQLPPTPGSDALQPIADATLSSSQDPPPETNLPEAPAPAEHPAVAAVLDKLEDVGSLKEARAVLSEAVGDKADDVINKLSETKGGREMAHEVLRDAMGIADPAGPKKYFATSLLRDGESIVQPGEEVTHVSGEALEELLARGAVELR